MQALRTQTTNFSMVHDNPSNYSRLSQQHTEEASTTAAGPDNKYRLFDSLHFGTVVIFGKKYTHFNKSDSVLDS